MIRPWHIWSAFALSLALLGAAMGWITLEAFQRAEDERLAEARILQDRDVELALWRMEAELNRIIDRESRRDHAAYLSFHPVFSLVGRGDLAVNRAKDLLIPSRLVVDLPPEVRLHFLFDEQRTLESPQCPQGSRARFAADNFKPSLAYDEASRRLEELRSTLGFECIDGLLPKEAFESDPTLKAAGFPLLPVQPLMQQARVPDNPDAEREWQARLHAYGNAASRRASSNDFQINFRNTDLPGTQPLFVREGPMHSLWVEGNLLLARRVWADGRVLIEGAWIDWPTLRSRLHGLVGDRVPGSEIVPLVSADNATRPFHCLASIPAHLVPGPLPTDGLASPPIHRSVLLGWVGFAALALVVGLLLAQVVSLSERRAGFVSSVTHEMRTPLTTFRLYADLLLSDRVSDPAKRKRYLETLGRESDRLAHLVENVLSYARLEGRRPLLEFESLSVDELVERSAERLRSRARQAEMELSLELEDSCVERTVKTNPEVVEQILFNLVDNASKYGGEAGSTIRFRASVAQGTLQLWIEDEGPGVDPEFRSRLFRPFEKGTRKDAPSVPGIGLGLALSRRLARGLGGDLEHRAEREPGCAMLLTLPIES